MRGLRGAAVTWNLGAGIDLSRVNSTKGKRSSIINTAPWELDPDHGCDLYPVSCLTCPFPYCRYDGDGEREERNTLIIELHVNGMPVPQIARKVGVSVTTVRVQLRSLPVTG